MDEINKLNTIKDDSNFIRRINNVHSTILPTTTAVTQETRTTQAGRCESDAIHPRLLNKHQEETVKCISCGQIFNSTSIDEIVEHYENLAHKEFFATCLYCGGQVHQYQHINEIRQYHSCSRCKSGKEK